jgi:actin related protein 2/3 complex subunit 1A/1B
MAACQPVPGCTNVACHAWNADMTLLALSPNSTEVHIYQTSGSTDATKWKKAYTLTEHTEFVSSCDWSSVNNMLVTCGHDRNAYVWNYDSADDTWKPTLVVLRINRSATVVRWSPAGNKFAVGSGAKCVPVCHYEDSSKWWISKMIKKHKSTVLDLAWCPNNKFLVTGAADYKCRIFSAYLKGIDDEADDGFGDVWKNQHKFGEVLQEFDQAKAWVQAVAWSPNGFRVAFAGHGASLHVAQLLAGGAPVVSSVYTKTLPYLAMEFCNDDTLLVSGFDRNPTVYKNAGGTWSESEKLDKETAVVKAGKSNFGAAKSMWSNKTDKGETGKDAGTTVKTIHQNIITSMVFCPDGKQVSTSGLDGRICMWPRPQ